MKKEKLIDYINLNYSTYKISNATGKSQTTVKYWLKKYNLKTNHISFKNRIPSTTLPENHCCPRCKIIKPNSEFYRRRNQIKLSSYCKICTNLQVVERSQLFKIKCLEYTGKVCSKCGYDKYVGALEFHHLDPNQKDFSISEHRVWKFDQKVKDELDKCIVLCSNCHKEAHYELRNTVGCKGIEPLLSE